MEISAQNKINKKQKLIELKCKLLQLHDMISHQFTQIYTNEWIEKRIGTNHKNTPIYKRLRHKSVKLEFKLQMTWNNTTKISQNTSNSTWSLSHFFWFIPFMALFHIFEPFSKQIEKQMKLVTFPLNQCKKISFLNVRNKLKMAAETHKTDFGLISYFFAPCLKHGAFSLYSRQIFFYCIPAKRLLYCSFL